MAFPTTITCMHHPPVSKKFIVIHLLQRIASIHCTNAVSFEKNNRITQKWAFFMQINKMRGICDNLCNTLSSFEIQQINEWIVDEFIKCGIDYWTGWTIKRSLILEKGGNCMFLYFWERCHVMVYLFNVLKFHLNCPLYRSNSNS